MPTYFASPTGSALNNGTLNSPWSLAHVAAGAGGVLGGGDIVALLSGTYNIPPNTILNFNASGTSLAPLLVRPAPGHYPIINGVMWVYGNNVWFYDLRNVWYHDGMRVTNQPGSSPTDLPRTTTGQFLALGNNVRVIECIWNDQAAGIFSAKGAQNFQAYGNILYNNGWIGPDRGHGHGFYCQNLGVTRQVLENNITFCNYSTGLKIGGTSGTELLSFDVLDNCSFNNQLPAYSIHGLDMAFHYQGAGLDKGDTNIVGNFLAQQHDPSTNAWKIGDGVAGAFPVVVTDNVVYGRTEINEWPSVTFIRNILSDFPRLSDINIPLGLLRVKNTASYIIDQNIYATRQTDSPFGRALILDATGRTFAQWQSMTTYDDNTTFIDGPLPYSVVKVVPSKYTTGRGHVYVYNPLGSASVQVNIGNIMSLRAPYSIYHVYDYVTGGPPTVSGIYDGNLITLPMTSKTPPTPFGGAPLPTQDNTFGAFVVTLQQGYTVRFGGGIG